MGGDTVLSGRVVLSDLETDKQITLFFLRKVHIIKYLLSNESLIQNDS